MRITISDNDGVIYDQMTINLDEEDEFIGRVRFANIIHELITDNYECIEDEDTGI